MNHFPRAGGMFLIPGGDGAGQERETTHAALAGVGSARVGTPDKTPNPRTADPISLSDRPIDERPTCAHDNTMHTGTTDRQRGGIVCQK